MPSNTPETQALLPVTAEDREAASTLIAWHNKVASEWKADGGNDLTFFAADMPDGIRRGIWDEHDVVQAFARHRLASLSTTTVEPVQEMHELPNTPPTPDQMVTVVVCATCGGEFDEGEWDADTRCPECEQPKRWNEKRTRLIGTNQPPAPTPDRIGKDAVREADEHYTIAMDRRPKEIGGVKVGPGLYRIHWKDGGSSLAAIGMCRNGAWWVAPTNWVEPAVAFRIDEDPEGRWSWAGVKALERLDPAALSATPAQEEEI